MPDVMWLFRRLRAMSVQEILWRVEQKTLQKREERSFGTDKTAVTERHFYPETNSLTICPERLYLETEGTDEPRTEIPLLGGFDYATYKKRWHAGFQTENDWPLQWSYSLNYKQRDDIGDARTNWELNRHFQFALLAKDYAATGERAYLDEFIDLFDDWNEKNPFLWGISWTSVMEIAIRCSNWCYAYCFLKPTAAPAELLDRLQTGIVNMTGYIVRHYSRFSSANNHLIVEAYAIGQSGILFDHRTWIDLSVELLTKELPRQNYSDGVNKELSLHYQSFYMEAMGLMLRLLRKNEYTVPDTWEPMLKKMCRYVAACRGENGEVVSFGDDDEGKILDLLGGADHYRYVLELFSCLLDERYVSLTDCCGNIRALFTREEREASEQKPMYEERGSQCFCEGGNSILRSDDGRVLIGIDHAALGFGSIAAHGHADALSFQMYVDGKPVFIDPGTYIYHCDIASRNAYRQTKNHNTVCIDDRDQSEMLGAFLWGRKAKCRLIEYREDEKGVFLSAEHDGYVPIIHKRSFLFDKKNKLTITDELSAPCRSEVSFLFAPDMTVVVQGTYVQFTSDEICGTMKFTADSEMKLSLHDAICSFRYGEQEQTMALYVETKASRIVSEIKVEAMQE